MKCSRSLSHDVNEQLVNFLVNLRERGIFKCILFLSVDEIYWGETNDRVLTEEL